MLLLLCDRPTKHPRSDKILSRQAVKGEQQDADKQLAAIRAEAHKLQVHSRALKAYVLCMLSPACLPACRPSVRPFIRISVCPSVCLTLSAFFQCDRWCVFTGHAFVRMCTYAYVFA